MIQTTEFYNDFLNYYDKAKALQLRNEKLLPQGADINVSDPLMMNIHIYDCIERRQAGFSNALEDLHGTRSPSTKARLKSFSKKNDKILTRFLHLFHRFTGSGASFESDHGYRNSHLGTLASMCEDAPDKFIAFRTMKHYIVNCKTPMVTSKGNQPPSLKNHMPEKYRLAMQYYIDNHAEEFINDYTDFHNTFVKPIGIQKSVNFCLKWHKDRGFKQWKFVMTAFVMDDAEYFPEDIDPNSPCYYGSNCIRTFKLMFEKPTKRVKSQEWHDMCMAKMVSDTKGQPYSLEDVACDMIRYWTEYIPKKGYEHLTDEQKVNNSILKVNGEYPEHIKQRLVKEIGYYKYGKEA